MAAAHPDPDHHWHQIEPGDVGFSTGSGFYGWIIRRATGSYGHAWVYHGRIGSGDAAVWITAEAGGDGVQYRVRSEEPVKVVRMWRNEQERSAILDASERLIGHGYDWMEIVRIALWVCGVRLGHLGRDDRRRVICSNHTAQAILAARPQLRGIIPYPPSRIWPSRLARFCDWVLWHQR